MSKARPHAHMYQKWVQGIRQAVPNDAERCALYEYIMAYQIASVYGESELPQDCNLSQAARLAYVMIEGDLQELCESRREVNSIRAKNGARNVPNSTEQNLTGASRSEQNLTEPIKTTQYKNNTIQSNYKGAEKIGIFDLGLFLLSQGYIVTPDKLRSVYANACSARSPQAYAAKAFEDSRNGSAQHGEGLQVANFVRATECTDLQALGVYGVAIESEVLAVRCTKAAAAAIGEHGTQNALQGYAKEVGCNTIKYYAQ